MNKPFALSVKVLVRDEEGLYLLLKRSAGSKANAGRWDMPGGKVDPGEGFEEALKREVLEETGLEVSLDGVAGSAESESPSRRIAYLIMDARVESGDLQLSAEHDEAIWVGRDELAKMDLCPQFIPFASAYVDGR